MLTFLTLLLGVVWGQQTLELNAPAGTAAVEIFLDGNSLARRHRPPWTFLVDLGPAPAPHHLDAVAFDARGTEIGRVRQKLNVPRRDAVATLALLPGKGGTGRAARLDWESLVHPAPLRVTVSFDGRPLAFTDPRRIELPPFVPEQVHFLRAVVQLERGFRAEAEITFGGRARDETSRELTAVALRVAGSARTAPDAMAGWLAADGAPLAVAAVEAGEGRVVFVLDAHAPDAFSRLFATLLFSDALSRLRGNPEVRTVFAYKSAVAGSRAGYDVYPRSFPLHMQDGLLRALAEQEPPSEAFEKCPRTADAATAAGLTAAAWSHPRAVVVVLSGDPDASILPAPYARSFLRDLGVPVFVWVVAPGSRDAAAVWGGGRTLRTRAELRAAVKELETALAEQRIVWVEGTHLPQSIAATSAAPKGVTVAR